MALSAPHPTADETGETVVLWSPVAVVGLNAVAGLVLGFAALARRLGSESCYGMCGESHIGNPIILVVVLSAGPAFYLAVLSFLIAALLVVRRPSLVRTQRGVGVVAAGAAALAVEWAISTIASDARWTEFPVDSARLLIVLSVAMPVPLALPAAVLVYAVVNLRQRRQNPTVLALGAAALADLIFGAYWWSFTDRSF